MTRNEAILEQVKNDYKYFSHDGNISENLSLKAMDISNNETVDRCIEVLNEWWVADSSSFADLRLKLSQLKKEVK